MEGLRANPLTEIAGYKVTSVTDYEKPEEQTAGSQRSDLQAGEQ